MFCFNAEFQKRFEISNGLSNKGHAGKMKYVNVAQLHDNRFGITSIDLLIDNWNLNQKKITTYSQWLNYKASL